MIGTDADDYEPPRDDEGETLSLDSVVSQLLELIMCIVEHPRLRSLLANGAEDTIHRAIGYMCMTAAQEEAWEVRYILILARATILTDACFCSTLTG